LDVLHIMLFLCLSFVVWSKYVGGKNVCGVDGREHVCRHLIKKMFGAIFLKIFVKKITKKKKKKKKKKRQKR
jgi:hypothetical protein